MNHTTTNLLQRRVRWIGDGTMFDQWGEAYRAPAAASDVMDARGIVVWRETSLGEIRKKAVEVAVAACGFAVDANLASAFALTVSVANLFPIHLKLLRDDELARRFVNMLHQDEDGREYFVESELDDDPALRKLVDFYVDGKILQRDSGRLYVLGSVLKQATLVL